MALSKKASTRVTQTVRPPTAVAPISALPATTLAKQVVAATQPHMMQVVAANAEEAIAMLMAPTSSTPAAAASSSTTPQQDPTASSSTTPPRTAQSSQAAAGSTPGPKAGASSTTQHRRRQRTRSDLRAYMAVRRSSRRPPCRSGWLWFARTPFELMPPLCHDLTSACAVRCPCCWARLCQRFNRKGYRRSHSKHRCPRCHREYRSAHPGTD